MFSNSPDSTTASREESPKFSRGFVSTTSSSGKPVTSATQARIQPRSCSTVIKVNALLIYKSLIHSENQLHSHIVTRPVHCYMPLVHIMWYWFGKSQRPVKPHAAEPGSSAPAGGLSWGGLGLVVLFRYTTSNFSRRRAIDLMWCLPLNRIWHDAVVLADCGADDLGCFGISGFICGISALDQDNQLLGVIAFDGKCRDGVRAYVIGSFL